MPGLDLQVDDFRWGNIRVGSVSALVLHEGDGFELVGLEGMGDGFLLQAQGRSRLSDTVDESSLTLELQSDDVGQALEFMGFRRGMDAREGRFEASVEWQGGLRTDWLSAIEGTARIDIRDGTLVGVEPGAGRVFGLLSIQALPRRLALDFKDVFGEGTAFDRITGDFRIEGGDAYTENLVMRGPAADMGVVGRAGLVARDYDQTAVIAADLGRTLPVAGTVVGGPVVGAALFILSELLRKPFEAQLTYRITGPWEDPVIERLGAQAPDTPPPSSPESPPESRPTHNPNYDPSRRRNPGRTRDERTCRRGADDIGPGPRGQSRIRGQLLESAARQGARLVVLPENFAFLGRSEADRVAMAEPPGAGPMQDFLAAQARELGLWIVGGTLPVLEAGESRPRAACLLYDAQGPPCRALRQDPPVRRQPARGSEGYRESDGIAPGAEAVVAAVPFGRLGLAVCYDMRFPGLFQVMSASGMDAVALPAAFTETTGRAHWELLVRARAVDNLACVLAAAQWGEHPGGRRTWGDSMIVNHWGEVLARRREGEGVVVADLDLAAQREARQKFPVLEHRRAQGTLRVRTEKDA